MKKYTVENQNVSVTTFIGTVATTELFAIATTVENAIEIAATLNVFNAQFKTN